MKQAPRVWAHTKDACEGEERMQMLARHERISRSNTMVVAWAEVDPKTGREVGHGREITAADLLAAWGAIPQGPAAIAEALKVPSLSHRVADRVMQKLRKLGVARFNKATKRWEQVCSE